VPERLRRLKEAQTRLASALRHLVPEPFQSRAVRYSQKFRALHGIHLARLILMVNKFRAYLII